MKLFILFIDVVVMKFISVVGLDKEWRRRFWYVVGTRMLVKIQKDTPHKARCLVLKIQNYNR